MSKMVTITEACRELHIARSTLERRMKRLNIKARSIGIDRRERYITDKDIADIRSAYAAIDERTRSRYVAQQKRNISAAQFESRIEQLEAEIARLMSHNAPQSDSDSDSDKVMSQYRPRSQRRAIIATTSGPLPDGWSSLTTFCGLHGIPVSTVRNAIVVGRLQAHRGEWLQGRATIKNALDETMQAAILAMYGNHDREGES